MGAGARTGGSVSRPRSHRYYVVPVKTTDRKFMTAEHLCVPHAVPEHSDRDQEDYKDERGSASTSSVRSLVTDFALLLL